MEEIDPIVVIEWAALHQSELLINWHRLRSNQPVEKIQPLDY